MNVRRLGVDDAREFKQLRLEGLKLHPEAFGASFDDEVAQPFELTAGCLADGVVFGAFDPSASLRGVIGLRKEIAPKIKHIATIWGMYVSPSSRGSGLAKKLLQTAVSDAFVDCQSIRLSVVTSNMAAKKLYQRAGFKEWAVDKKALLVNGVFFDEVLMRLDLE